MKNFSFKGLVGVALLAAATVTQAGFIDIVGENNSLTFGNVGLINDQIEGRVAASGSVYLESFGVARSVGAASYSVVAGSDVTLINGQINNGGIYSGGKVKLVGATVFGDVVQYGSSSPINFAAKLSEATTLSDFYADQVATGSVTGSGNVKLSGSLSGVNYFTIDAAKLGTISKLTVDIPLDAYAVINVTGTNFASSWGNYTDDVNAARVLYNFNDATSLTLNGSIDGSILAAKADIRLNYGSYYGAIVSKSLSGQGQLHMANFTPPEENVPEGSTVAYLLLGGVALVVISRKKLIA